MSKRVSDIDVHINSYYDSNDKNDVCTRKKSFLSNTILWLDQGLLSFFSTMIYRQIYVRHPCFLSFLSAFTLSLHCFTTVRCMVNFRPMHG